MNLVAPSDNPFTPSFGSLPPILVGRDHLLHDIQIALATGPRHPGFTALLLGPRGTGKTTALLTARDEAQAAGWTICKVEALVPDADVPLHQAVMEVAQDRINVIAPKTRRDLTQVHVGPFGAGWESATPPPRESRRMERALAALTDLVVDQGGAGVLVIVDEFHNVHARDASVIASAFQQLAKDQGKPVAFLGAGLPHVEHTLLPNKGFTFFQRCMRHRLKNLEILEAKQALSVPLEGSGTDINDHLLCRAAGATRGYPYAVQSLGFHLWNAIRPGSEAQESHLHDAIDRMSRDLAENVTTPIWHRLSSRSRAFLAAMAEDQDTSHISDIAQRIQTSPSVTNTYRQRLINEGAIRAAGHGLVAFADARIRELAKAHQAELTAWRVASQNQAASSDENDATQESDYKKPRCEVILPIAQRPCIRPQGHTGPHRST